VGDALSQTLTYTFDTADGYYKSGSEILPWPSNFLIFSSNGFGAGTQWSAWSTNDTSNQNVRYGGVLLNYHATTGAGIRVYRLQDSTFLNSTYPTTSVSTGMDVALPGSVSMESGAKINLKANSTWAHDVTVTPVT